MISDNLHMNSMVTRLIRQRPSRSSVQVIGGMSSLAPREAASLKILLVDDCPLQQLLTSALLSKWGIQPMLAGDGLEAVLLAGEQHFDLILMDIQMGVLNGVLATQRIRQTERRLGAVEVPIIAYTAEPILVNGAAWADAGVSASLAKPCAPADMGECLKQWCGVQPEWQQQ